MTAVNGEVMIGPGTARKGRDASLSTRVTAALAAAALAGAIALRFFIARGQPLWLDETWTGAIAAQPGFAAVWRQVWLDVNAPLYYLFMHLWAGLFGLSDEALRLPSALFGATAPLAIACCGIKGLSRPARLTWAVLLALWVPGIWLAGDARCYALLLFLCTLQAMAFIRLVRAPGLARAALWCGISSLAVATHYHGLLPTGLQGLAYLAMARGRALRTWPAALLFVPVAGWLAVHAPRIAAFAAPGVAWYPTLRLSKLDRLLSFPLGTPDLSWTVVAILALSLALGLIWRGQAPPRRQAAGGAWMVTATALVGAAAVVILGFVRPSFTDRYLVPFIPGLLLGVALVAQSLARRIALTYAALIVAAMVTTAPWAMRELRTGWRWYNWEIASQDLMRGRPRRLVFLWDHPATAILDPSQLDAVGGFFFRRQGHPIEVRPVVVGPGEDPNAKLLAAAGEPETAILWAYDIGVRGTAARRYKPQLSALDSRLACRDYGRGSVGVVACDRAGSVETHP